MTKEEFTIKVNEVLDKLEEISAEVPMKWDIIAEIKKGYFTEFSNLVATRYKPTETELLPESVIFDIQPDNRFQIRVGISDFKTMEL